MQKGENMEEKFAKPAIGAIVERMIKRKIFHYEHKRFRKIFRIK